MTISRSQMKKKLTDLTGDGKITRADVLKGRGVFSKGGTVMKSKGGTVMKSKGGTVKMSKGGAVNKKGFKAGGSIINPPLTLNPELRKKIKEGKVIINKQGEVRVTPQEMKRLKEVSERVTRSLGDHPSNLGRKTTNKSKGGAVKMSKGGAVKMSKGGAVKMSKGGAIKKMKMGGRVGGLARRKRATR
tara:strand:+ start:550 stop:1113 length:564 start_codon:yes stop_codon:yes gene_type:complete